MAASSETENKDNIRKLSVDVEMLMETVKWEIGLNIGTINTNIKYLTNYAEKLTADVEKLTLTVDKLTAEVTDTSEIYCYHNWDESHDILKTYSYVEFSTYVDRITFCHQLFYYSSGQHTELIYENIAALFNSLIWTVGKYNRFRASGRYLQLSKETIHELYVLLSKIRSGSVMGATSVCKHVLETVKLDCDRDIGNRLFTCATFEREHDLEWLPMETP